MEDGEVPAEAISDAPIIQASMDPTAEIKDQVYGLWSNKKRKKLKKIKRNLKLKKKHL